MIEWLVEMCFVNCCLYYLCWDCCFFGKEQPVCFVLVFRTIDMFLWSCGVMLASEFLGWISHSDFVSSWFSNTCSSDPRLTQCIHVPCCTPVSQAWTDSLLIFCHEITNRIFSFKSSERRSVRAVQWLNPTRQSATGIGWMGSLTGWWTSCRFLRRCALAWTNCRSSVSAWDIWGSRASSKVKTSHKCISKDLLKCQCCVVKWNDDKPTLTSTFAPLI